MVPVLVVDHGWRTSDDDDMPPGIHVHFEAVSFTVHFLGGWGLSVRHARGWADAYVALRLGPLLLEITWDVDTERL